MQENSIKLENKFTTSGATLQLYTESSLYEQRFVPCDLN